MLENKEGIHLSYLKGLLGAERRKESFDFSCLNKGIPRGAITEIQGELGAGKTDFILSFLSENSERVAWIEEDFSIYPFVFVQKKITLDRILFLSPEKELLWSAQQVLQSGLFKILILYPKRLRFSEKQMRRLQLSAEVSRASVILLNEAQFFYQTWMVSLRVRVNRSLEKGKSMSEVLRRRRA